MEPAPKTVAMETLLILMTELLLVLNVMKLAPYAMQETLVNVQLVLLVGTHLQIVTVALNAKQNVVSVLDPLILNVKHAKMTISLIQIALAMKHVQSYNTEKLRQ